jgi:PLD-like domain/Helicase conserved C-terminal domain/SNF2-related domain
VTRPEFIDNQGERTLANALRDLAEDPGCKHQQLDIASGYFNVAGFLQAADVIESRPAFRLLIGAEPEGPLHAQADGRPLGTEARRGLEDLERHLADERDALPFSRQAAEEVLRLARLLRRDTVEVRRYLKRFLHGKAYLFRGQGVIAGSANFTYGGLVHNRELSIAQYQPNVIGEAEAWFDALWEDAEDYRERLIELITAREADTWTPHDVYLRALLELYRDELGLLEEEDEDADGYTPGQPGGVTLVDFQRHGFRRALRVIERLDGVLIGDGVGLGKSFIGSKLLDHYVNREGLRALVIVPAALRDSFWERHLHEQGIAGQVVSYQALAAERQLGGDREVLKLSKDAYRFVLVDEAHAFRNPDTDQYRALSRLMGGARKKLCLMTATPVNNSIRDLYHQLMLFARHTARFKEIGVPDLNAYFRAAEDAAESGDSSSAMFKLIDATSVRRTRRFIQTHYPNAHLEGEPIRFPEARLKTKLYELDDAYPGLFAKVRDNVDALTLARYQPDNYRLDEEVDRRAQTLAGILRTGLLKRFESSVHAFRLTLDTMIDACDRFSVDLAQGRVLTPGARRSSGSEAEDPAALARGLGEAWSPVAEYRAVDLRRDVERDAELLRELREAVTDATIDNDPKLEALSELLLGQLGPEKAIIFSYYADTVDWIEQALASDANNGHQRFGERRYVVVTGTGDEGPRERLRRVHQFCPITTTDEAGGEPVAPEDEKDLLITTDVLAEGQNLQQARYIVNYDMPWNPMRLVQRNGRIDRLNSPFAGQEIYLYNLFPAGELDEILKLYERLLRKIAHANISVGMEAPVFEDAAATERNFADTAEQIRGIVGEDDGILDAAEAQLDAFSGEEFRMELRSALAAERLRELLAMPHGAGSGFRNEALPEGTQGIFFCVRVLLGPRSVPSALDERAWRYIDLVAADEPLRDELEILKRIRCRDGTPRELPEEVAPTLYELWNAAQGAVMAEYEERLDPLRASTRIPSSQSWAIDMIAGEGTGLADRGVRASALREAASALSVPRGPLVLRRLSALRRELRDGDLTPAAAVLGVLETVEREGLRPVDEESDSRPPTITPERVRLVCYQVIHG